MKLTIKVVAFFLGHPVYGTLLAWGGGGGGFISIILEAVSHPRGKTNREKWMGVKITNVCI